MSKIVKKYTSFEEMYDDLKKDPNFIDSKKDDIQNEVNKLIKKIESSKSSKDFFDSTCILSSIFESLDNKTLNDVYNKTNVYVLVLGATFTNPSFNSVLLDLIRQNKGIDLLTQDKINLEKLIFINTVLSLAFFGISINYQNISKSSIEFFRKNITDLLKLIIKKDDSKKITFTELCSFLERISWDIKFQYNINYNAKFPIKLSDDHLFKNLKTSRSFAGVIFTSLLIRPKIENIFKGVVTNLENDNVRISVALDSIYRASNDLGEKISHYYRNTPKDIADFFDIFIKNNEKNLIFCLRNFCRGFHFQGSKKFIDIVFEKNRSAIQIKDDFILYMKNNFIAFNVKNNNEVYDEWTNKLFLISIKSLSVLNEFNYALNKNWALKASVFELNLWINEVHEVLNKYYIDDDWDRIKDYVFLENERIEWKSSFLTSIQQDLLDESMETHNSKKNLDRIIRVIISMMNTDGGIIVVGLVENPNEIKREYVKQYLLKKEGITFFDISSEFKRYFRTLDSIRLEILDRLKNLTNYSTDKFNGLFELEPIILRDENMTITVIKIIVKKSEDFIYNFRKENETVWISLTKRAQGQTIDVDIRNYIKPEI